MLAQGDPDLAGRYIFPDGFGGMVCNELTGGECIEFQVSDRRWQPGGIQAWVLFSLSFGAAVLAFRCARSLGLGQSAGRLWAASAALLGAYAIFVPFNLEKPAERFLRLIAQEQGWYEMRQGPQILALASAGFATCALYYLITRRGGATGFSARAMFVFSAALLLVALARISSWDAADPIFEAGPAQFDFGRFLEFACAAFAGACAAFAAPKVNVTDRN